jgi:hypothetical protein
MLRTAVTTLPLKSAQNNCEGLNPRKQLSCQTYPGLVQIAVSTMLAPQSSSGRTLPAEHCRYGAMDLSLLEICGMN